MKQTIPSVPYVSQNSIEDGAPGVINYKPDWAEIFGAINNVLSLLLMIIYFIGVIVINS